MVSNSQPALLWLFAAIGLLAGCRGYRPDQPPATTPVAGGSSVAPAISSTNRPAESQAPAADAAAPVNSADTLPENILAWDAKAKSFHANLDDDTASFTFGVTNISPFEVVIESTATSCGCTVADLPADPWKLPPGGDGQLQVTVDLSGETGTIAREVMVITSLGSCLLTVEAVIPDPSDAN